MIEPINGGISVTRRDDDRRSEIAIERNERRSASIHARARTGPSSATIRSSMSRVLRLTCSMPVPKQDIQQIIQRIDPGWILRCIQPLEGRASSLVVTTGEQISKRLILLTHSQSDRERNPHIARDEYRLLTTLKETGLPVADALYLSEEHEPPFLITSFVEGSTDVNADNVGAFCRRLAEILHDIHAVDLSQYDLSFLPDIDDAITWEQKPRASEQVEIHAAMQRALPRVEFNEPALLLGDFWPGNLLWIGDELSAILDWEDAKLGDPLADLGKSRLEILWALGREAMNAYTANYLALNRTLNGAALPFWDLWGASRLSHYASFAPEPGVIQKMRAQYEAFVADAIQRLEAL